MDWPVSAYAKKIFSINFSFTRGGFDCSQAQIPLQNQCCLRFFSDAKSPGFALSTGACTTKDKFSAPSKCSQKFTWVIINFF